MVALAELELDVLAAEDRFDFLVEAIVNIRAGLACAIVAYSLGVSGEILVFPVRAAVVAGVFESACGACKAGCGESFEDTVHIHVHLVVVVFGLFNSD